MNNNDFLKDFPMNGTRYQYYDIPALEKSGIADISRLPFSIRVLVENLLRKMDGKIVKEEDLLNIAGWKTSYPEPVEIPHHPARVLMQDFTGVPAVVDLASMREAVRVAGGDPGAINPLIPVELVIDHSVQVDYSGTSDSLKKNVEMEYQRNGERYRLLKWAQKSFDNFHVVPPSSGICHQVNLEHLGRVMISETGDTPLVYPDSLVGTDSHTTMINGLGVLGWGVGGIEAEAVMLGQPYYMSIPEVIGVRMTGKPKKHISAMDIVLTITEMLRKIGVVEKFVEFFGPGMKALSLPDRATIANMSPEYGATMGFFPVDEKTVDYLRLTARNERADIVECITREMGLFYTGSETPEYSRIVDVDLSTVEPSLAGPARPQDRIPLSGMKEKFEDLLGCMHERDADIKNISAFHDESGTQTEREHICIPNYPRQYDVPGTDFKIAEGSVVIAAITSCTNTSNPASLITAGLLAKNAVKRGIHPPSHVKRSFVPGSKAVFDYLTEAGLMPYFEALGFHIVGFGCTTCIGNSGPLHPGIEQVIKENDLTVAAVLSGNRNFEARIHQRIKGNYLASPMLVIAFALAGKIDIDMTRDPIGTDPNGAPVMLKDLEPSSEEIEALVQKYVKREFFEKEYGKIYEGDEFWKDLTVSETKTFHWMPESTYIRNPPYFEGFSADAGSPSDIENARVLVILGDSVTTDHISPAGAIAEQFPAGKYLIEKGVDKGDFNSYGSRRGNHEVMMRGTFGNIRIKNRMVEGKEGSFTMFHPDKKEMFIYDAALAYQASGTPLIVLGGKEYGTGSSRDWAAKGTTLLGVKAVIAESFERIHRSNLVGMGVLPLTFESGKGWEAYGLDGSEVYTLRGIVDMKPRKTIQVTAKKQDGTTIEFSVTARLDTDIEVEYFIHGGILPFVLRKIMK